MSLIYKEHKHLRLPDIDREVAGGWKEKRIFERSISEREGRPPFVFYEGPPSANGMPGIHHVMARAIKDIFCRYHTMMGKQVKRKAGWDTHGLPIELAVEKTLGIRKDDIGKKISIEDYNKACRTEVMKYTGQWEELTDLMGYWVDMQHPYITYETRYIESVWWLLRNLYDKQLLYKGFTIQPYSPAAGTGLSTHELNQPGTYKPVKDTTVVAQFKMNPDPRFTAPAVPAGMPVYFLAWTTTPWTLPSNTALAVGRNITYVLVETLNQYTGSKIFVLLAKDLVSRYFLEKNATLDFEGYKTGDKNLPYRIHTEYAGKELAGLTYEQLLPLEANQRKFIEGEAFRVVIGDFVSTEDGTGIVHIAPSFGADDFRTAKQNGLGTLTLVDKRGRFIEGVKDARDDFSNEFVKEQYLSDEEKEAERRKQGGDKYLSVDERLSIKLKKENKAFRVEKYEHNYPHCWRTDKPILYYPLDSWFVKTTARKDRMVELNKTIHWKPEATGTGRFGNWLENLQDWNLSRSRFWGVPLPIWRSEDQTEEKCIGSVSELKEEIEKSVQAGFLRKNPLEAVNGLENLALADLHRPYVDEIILVSPSGKPMSRETDLIDVWFDSGSMPYAQLHYPFENKEQIDQRTAFPADFIAEGVDQTRGWFFTLHAIATLCFDSVAYKNVVSNGLVLDKNGNKMSKRLGNGVDPFETLNKYGADATRWYMIANAAPWDNLKFDPEGIAEVQRKFFGTLFNTYGFFALYANIDRFVYDPDNLVPPAEKPEMDRWISSRLHSLLEEVNAAYSDYEPHRAARAIESFVDEHLSNWYIRLSRRRFWKGELNSDKKAAYETLYECLLCLSQMMCPVAPFFGDWLYRNLNGPLDSVHLSLMPQADRAMQDKPLEQKMELAQTICSLVLSIRKKVNIKVRQPLSRILVPVLNGERKMQVTEISPVILHEVNVKELEILEGKVDFITKKARANFKTLGQKLGKRMKAGAEVISLLSDTQINDLELNGRISLSIDNEPFELSLADVEILTEDVEGWQTASKGDVTVALDIQVTDALKAEGDARELINRIQKLRKDSQFNVTDRIRVIVEKQPFIETSINQFKNYICAEILADDLQLAEVKEGGVTVEINELPVKLIINKT